jgi:hypothetical protein
MNPEVQKKLRELAEKYKLKRAPRNEANLCSFWVKGECNRGEHCPFRHQYMTHDIEETKGATVTTD